MAVLTLRFLGGFEARRSSGEAAEIPIRKGQALLAFLALNPGGSVARAKLAGLLWGDCDEMQARTNLRQTLTVLRRALGPAEDRILHADRRSVGLHSADIDVDAVLFEDLIANGTPRDLEAAMALYRGDLLDGLDISDPGFQAWLEDERRRLHDLMTGALNALMLRKRADGAPEEAISLARRLLTLDPLREDVHCALMVLYADLGQRHAVQQQYRRCRGLLASELNVAPAAETEALYRTLLDNDTAGAGVAKVSDAIVVRRHETDDGAKVSLDNRFGDPPARVTGALPGSLRRAAAVGRAAMIGGFAALSWLLAWGHPIMPSPPDLLAFLKTGVLSSGGLSGVPEGVSDSSGPALPDRMALPLAGLPSPTVSPATKPPRVLKHVTGYSADTVSAVVGPGDEERLGAEEARHAMQHAADGVWAELADSWDLRAVRAFKTRYPEARQVAEADLRIAFLIRRHREAQTELNRLGYEAGPVDGAWGPRSARAMRAFQSDNGLAPDGVVAEAALDRLKIANPKITTPTIPTPEPEPEVAIVSFSTQDGDPESRHWTASGELDGVEVIATGTRRGDTLKLVFDVDSRYWEQGGNRYGHRFTQSCTISASGPVFECWIPERPGYIPGAKVFGTFPQLTYRMLGIERSSNRVPGDIVLDFRSELETATSKIAMPIISTPEPQPQPVRPEPEVALVSFSTQDGDPESRRWTASGESHDGSKVMATANRRGDSLTIVFDVDRRDATATGISRYTQHYTHSCTVSVADAVFDCWLTRGRNHLDSIVSGTFPRLRYKFMRPVIDNRVEGVVAGDVVLQFHPVSQSATHVSSFDPPV